MVRLLTSTWLLGALIGLACWRPDRSLLAPRASFDASWPIGLSEATDRGLDFGTEIVFTYGPLGFLEIPLLTDPGLAKLSVAYAIATWVGLGISLLYAARRSFPLALAFPLALLVGLLVAPRAGSDYPVIPLVLLWCLIAVTEGAPARARRLLPFLGGFASAVLLLLKLNVGGLVLALCAVAAATMEPGRVLRRLAAFAGTFAISFLALWLLTAQSLGSIPEFVDRSLEIVSGYSTALSVDTVDDGWRYQLGAAALIGLALAAPYLGGRGATPSRRAALVALVAIAGFFAWKSAFVRHEEARAVVVASVPLAALLAFTWKGRQRALALAGVVAVTAMYFPLTGHRLDYVFRPLESIEDAVYTVRAVIDPAERDEILAAAREGLTAFYGLDPRTASLLEGERVHVHPYETGIVWTYGLDWAPLPVFQSLSAYTPPLDRLNAEWVEASDGPSRILVHAPSLSFGVGADYLRSLSPSQKSELEASNDLSVDGRYLTYEQPEANLAMLCNFTPLRTTLAYQVLGRVGDRCGEPQLLESVEAESGESVPIPEPGSGEVVFARVEGLEPEGLERLGTLLYRGPYVHVSFDSERSFRLAPEVAGDGLLLSAPEAIDFPEPFRLAPRAKAVSFSEDPGFLSSPGELRIDFYAMRGEE